MKRETQGLTFDHDVSNAAKPIEKVFEIFFTHFGSETPDEQTSSHLSSKIGINACNGGRGNLAKIQMLQ